jgi:NAD(P)H-hydrate epimerase
MSLTREQVRDIDRRAVEEFGLPGVVLMENAGRGAAAVLRRLNPGRRRVVVLCGKGNNGGDGFVIARHLDNDDWPVGVLLFAEPKDLSADAAVNFEVLRRAGVPIGLAAGLDEKAFDDTLVNSVSGAEGWLVDCLFGTGLTGPVGAPFDKIIAAVNTRAAAHVLAMDVPSGLDCDTGKPLGPTVQADHTVTCVAPKSGFANAEAAAWLGEVHVVPIGVPRALLSLYGIDA